MPEIEPPILAFYSAGLEEARLSQGMFRLERERTEELLARYLPPAPAEVLDVGGGPGRYACWLAGRGYAVDLVDAVPLHVEQARAACRAHPAAAIRSASVGDARQLERADRSADVVLLLGPLYHLDERADRVGVWREARRVLRPNGVALAAGISRFAPLFEGLVHDRLADPVFSAIVAEGLRSGRHRNPTDRLEWFTSAYLHRPDELRAEAIEAGFQVEALLGIEGPGWMCQDFDRRWEQPVQREQLLDCARRVEAEESLLGLSSHLMVIARNG